MRPAHVSIALATALLGVTGCGAPPIPCASSLACGEGRACGLDGACGEPPAAPRPEQRTEHRAPSRWAATDRARPRELEGPSDTAHLGGPTRGVLWLAFDPLRAPPARALIVLGAAERDARRARGSIVIARRVGDGAEIARTLVPAGPARAIVVDVTAALADAPALEIAIDATEPLRVATPRHVDPRARPRLELVLEAASARQ